MLVRSPRVQPGPTTPFLREFYLQAHRLGLVSRLLRFRFFLLESKCRLQCPRDAADHAASGASDLVADPRCRRHADERRGSARRRSGSRLYANRAAVPPGLLHELPRWGETGGATRSEAVRVGAVGDRRLLALESRRGEIVREGDAAELRQST